MRTAPASREAVLVHYIGDTSTRGTLIAREQSRVRVVSCGPSTSDYLRRARNGVLRRRRFTRRECRARGPRRNVRSASPSAFGSVMVRIVCMIGSVMVCTVAWTLCLREAKLNSTRGTFENKGTRSSPSNRQTLFSSANNGTRPSNQCLSSDKAVLTVLIHSTAIYTTNPIMSAAKIAY